MFYQACLTVALSIPAQILQKFHLGIEKKLSPFSFDLVGFNRQIKSKTTVVNQRATLIEFADV